MPTPTRRTRLTIAAVILVAAPIASLAIGGVAEAHRNDESYIYLDVGDTTLSGRVELPYPDLREVFGLELSGSADDLLAELEANVDELHAYLLETTDVGDWELTFDGVELLEEEGVGDDGAGYALFPFDVDLAGADVPQLIDVTFTPFLAEIPDRNNVALVSNDWQRGVVEEETNELLVLTPGSPSGTIDLGETNQWRNFTSSIRLGVDHIRTGPDHIFFVLVLLLPSVLVLVLGRWRPAPTFSGSLWRVVGVATMFTVAHSITFTLAGLDLLPLPPSKFVETLIAASIAAAALHNIKPIFGHREWLIAFAFGLFHGMGFAGLVEDLDIDRGTQLVSLLGRNLGIEIGQLVIIAITFGALFALRRTRAYLPLMYLGSAVLAIVSTVWMIERIFEVDSGINDTIDRVVLWPRSLYVMIALTVLAVGYRAIEASRGRLLPVADRHGDDADEVSDEDRERVSV